jgi:hypothetical protein
LPEHEPVEQFKAMKRCFVLHVPGGCRKSEEADSKNGTVVNE